jgi:hypothetical protein
MSSPPRLAHKIIIPKPYNREATVAQTIAKEYARLEQEERTKQLVSVWHKVTYIK